MVLAGSKLLKGKNKLFYEYSYKIRSVSEALGSERDPLLLSALNFGQVLLDLFYDCTNCRPTILEGTLTGKSGYV